jgi:prepilin signal peptidase PulO-like enzyme (type II secretory pathway)
MLKYFPNFPSYETIFDTLRHGLMYAASGLPQEAWWLPVLVLLILGAAALVDAVTSTIPDPLVFLGLIVVTATQGLYVSWPFAAQHLMWGLVAAMGLWAVNQCWYTLFKRDALGMGDGKWTMLVVACFGVMPAVFAWGLGACLAILWMGLSWAARVKITRVYFAPFLFIGLLAGIYWLGPS